MSWIAPVSIHLRGRLLVEGRRCIMLLMLERWWHKRGLELKHASRMLQMMAGLTDISDGEDTSDDEESEDDRERVPVSEEA